MTAMTVLRNVLEKSWSSSFVSKKSTSPSWEKVLHRFGMFLPVEEKNFVTLKIFCASFFVSGITVELIIIFFWSPHIIDGINIVFQIKETVPLHGRASILGDQRNNFFTDVVCGYGSMADKTYSITQSGLLCEFNSKRLLTKWVKLRVSIPGNLTIYVILFILIGWNSE